MTADVAPASDLLDESRCLELLAANDFGRVAVSIGAMPAIFPVNFCFAEGRILFYAEGGSRLAAALQHAVVAFEVDETDGATRQGWSIQVVGVAGFASASEGAAAGRAGLRHWPTTHRQVLVSLDPGQILGRRLPPADAGEHVVL